MREHDSANATSDSAPTMSLNDIAEAIAFKNKLIEFDRTRFELSLDQRWHVVVGVLVLNERELSTMRRTTSTAITNG